MTDPEIDIKLVLLGRTVLVFAGATCGVGNWHLEGCATHGRRNEFARVTKKYPLAPGKDYLLLNCRPRDDSASPSI
jgi:hypothetical protein